MRGKHVVSCAQAQGDTPGFVDGQRIHDLCKHSSATALGYTLGVIDTNLDIKIIAQVSRARGDPVGIPEMLAEETCLPQNIVGETLGDIVCKYVSDNPGKRQAQGSSIVWTAITAAYGTCK